MPQPETEQKDPLTASFEEWRNDPSPDKLNKVVDNLEPTIKYTLNSLNSADDPVMRSQARLFAAKALKKYDPGRGANIRTHVSNQLKQMGRFARSVKSPIRIPERKEWEKNALYKSEQDFIEKKGREPSLMELSDWFGESPEKIKQLRSIPHTVRQSDLQSDEEGDPVDVGNQQPDFLSETMDYVYHELDPTDQRIFEHMTGYGGKEMISPAELGAKLNVSQSQISRRFARMMSRMYDIENDLREVAS